MKNYRNGPSDVSPPIHHADLRPCISRIGFRGHVIEISPGPTLQRVHSAYELVRG
ncbi:hypothetical protein [Mesorhizobium sp. M7A.F.Ca.CA.004.02.1.1]|uniref:hypothetical protein n=1 Tax=Mesorhizobium sp. M7A.F.Ca.CA.004.02.1.1 TaxID=2496690 RepID=UPI0013DE99B5|nr:hypothetical protein [Mesorhizobium sp. M7A.F.Ca.CA.004.02.1.1]